LIPNATSESQHTEKIINYRGISIYRIQNSKSGGNLYTLQV